MNSQPSASALEGAYDKLHPKIQRWISDQQWDELREIQARTINAVLDSDEDILIAASTAAGKTEAAFLPVLTAIAGSRGGGFSVLYISPLKALINDQFKRLEDLCEKLEVPVVKWHGDAPQSDKNRARARPGGVALITPESIEAMFVRRPADAQRMLGNAAFIVIDEVHSFLSGPRGLHVASLLRRIDAMSSKAARRIGLSATIGDLPQAAAWLRPTAPDTVEILEALSDKPELRLQIRGYVEPPDLDDPDHAEGVARERTDDTPGEEADTPTRRIALDDIADHLFANLRGSNNLVFGGSRRTVESAADRLRRRCDDATVPNEFFPHHGSLSKALREELEDRLRDGRLPTTGICTSTLELGIDIGSVKSVAQIGGPRSLSSLRQRLGRTGRRKGTPSILRIYVREPHVGQNSGILDGLRLNTVRSVAAIRLLLQNFVEPATNSPEVASTLVHQILSVIAERGGVRPKPLYDLLCGPGPFSSISPSDFASLLRHLATEEVKFIEQAPDGILMLAEDGELTVQARSFFAVFESAEEWRLVTGQRTLGTLPISTPVHKDGLVIFGGQRWVILDVDERTNTLLVASHRGGKIPKFDGTGSERLHDRLVAEMRIVFESSDVPGYLDKAAVTLLAEGRARYADLQLGNHVLVTEDRSTHVFLWRGSQATAVFGAALARVGIKCAIHDIGLTAVGASTSDLLPALRRLADEPVSPKDLAASVENIKAGKFREQVSDDVSRKLWAEQNEGLIREIPKMALGLVNAVV
jgi:ATP-dependent Lhr-like helicase